MLGIFRLPHGKFFCLASKGKRTQFSALSSTSMKRNPTFSSSLLSSATSCLSLMENLTSARRLRSICDAAMAARGSLADCIEWDKAWGKRMWLRMLFVKSQIASIFVLHWWELSVSKVSVSFLGREFIVTVALLKVIYLCLLDRSDDWNSNQNTKKWNHFIMACKEDIMFFKESQRSNNWF